MSLGKERAIVTPAIISKWFREMKAHLDGQDLTLLSDPKRLYNSDETGFSFDAKGRKVVAFKGSKRVYAVSANTRTQVTDLATMSAAGHYLPPMRCYRFRTMGGLRLQYSMHGCETFLFHRQCRSRSPLCYLWMGMPHTSL